MKSAKEGTKDRKESVEKLPIVTHDATGVAFVQHPAKRLGEVVRGIDDPGDVAHDEIAGVFPVLDGEVLDVDMTGTLGRNLGIDHLECGDVVDVERGRAGLSETELAHDGAQVLGVLGSKDSSKELCLSRAGGSDGLRLGAVRDSAAAEEEGVACSRAAGSKIVSVGSVDVTKELERRLSGGKLR